MQETNFSFEIIVRDDASTDNTPKIIREYKNKYPNFINPIYEKENQYSKGIKALPLLLDGYKIIFVRPNFLSCGQKMKILAHFGRVFPLIFLMS
jgi:glycosyltransferase involved in cell wall biosynthesis